MHTHKQNFLVPKKDRSRKWRQHLEKKESEEIEMESPLENKQEPEVAKMPETPSVPLTRAEIRERVKIFQDETDLASPIVADSKMVIKLRNPDFGPFKDDSATHSDIQMWKSLGAVPIRRDEFGLQPPDMQYFLVEKTTYDEVRRIDEERANERLQEVYRQPEGVNMPINVQLEKRQERLGGGEDAEPNIRPVGRPGASNFPGQKQRVDVSQPKLSFAFPNNPLGKQ